LLTKSLKRIKHLKRNKELQKQKETSDLSNLKPGSGLSPLLCAGPDLPSWTLELCREVQLQIKARDCSLGTVKAKTKP